MRCASLGATAAQQGRLKQAGELIAQDQSTPRFQDPEALGETGSLIAPVIERGAGDHQGEAAIGR